MGRGDVIIVELHKLLPSWEFLGLDADGILGRIITMLYKTMSLSNCYFVQLGLIVEAMCKESDNSFRLCNIYDPYEYHKIF